MVINKLYSTFISNILKSQDPQTGYKIRKSYTKVIANHCVKIYSSWDIIEL